MNKKFFKEYCNKVEPLLLNLLNAERKPLVYQPTLFAEKNSSYAKKYKIFHDLIQSQQKEGFIAQVLLGNWVGWIDLDEIGVPLKERKEFSIKNVQKQPDICKEDKTAMIELKNKWNTVTGGNIKSVIYTPLADWKKQNPSTDAIWGIVNPAESNRNLTKQLYFQGVEIKKIQGLDLFKYVCNYEGFDYSEYVIKFGQKIVNNYYKKN